MGDSCSVPLYQGPLAASLKDASVSVHTTNTNCKTTESLSYGFCKKLFNFILNIDFYHALFRMLCIEKRMVWFVGKESMSNHLYKTSYIFIL